MRLFDAASRVWTHGELYLVAQAQQEALANNRVRGVGGWLGGARAMPGRLTKAAGWANVSLQRSRAAFLISATCLLTRLPASRMHLPAPPLPALAGCSGPTSRRLMFRARSTSGGGPTAWTATARSTTSSTSSRPRVRSGLPNE